MLGFVSHDRPVCGSGPGRRTAALWCSAHRTQKQKSFFNNYMSFISHQIKLFAIPLWSVRWKADSPPTGSGGRRPSVTTTTTNTVTQPADQTQLRARNTCRTPQREGPTNTGVLLQGWDGGQKVDVPTPRSKTHSGSDIESSPHSRDHRLSRKSTAPPRHKLSPWCHPPALEALLLASGRVC